MNEFMGWWITACLLTVPIIYTIIEIKRKRKNGN